MSFIQLLIIVIVGYFCIFRWYPEYVSALKKFSMKNDNTSRKRSGRQNGKSTTSLTRNLKNI